MNARVTLVGMENYLNGLDTPKSLTDKCVMDSQESDFDPQVLLAAIIMKGGTFEPLYTDPLFYYKMVEMWWKKWSPTFNHWDEVLRAEYNPIWNKNYWREGHEDTYDSTSGAKEYSSTVTTDNDTTEKVVNKEVTDDDTTWESTSNTVEQLSGKDMVDHDSNRDIDVENRVSAFDANTYQPHDNSHTDDVLNSENTDTTYGKRTQTDVEADGSGTDDKTVDFTGNKTGTDDTTQDTEGTESTEGTADRDYDISYHEWGNIGVTTSQKMVTDELKLRYFDLYEHISDIFVDELCVRVF